jgi:succinyl-diaminopimelate desuccinylase
MPERGVNAIYKAARGDKARALRLRGETASGARVADLNVGTIAGGLNINSVPDGVTIGIDIRTIPGRNTARWWNV